VITKKPSLVFLMETKLHKKRMDAIWVKTCFQNLFLVESLGRSEGLALLWSDEVHVEIQNYSTRHINAVVNFGHSNT
jgi:hypothetical protein